MSKTITITVQDDTYDALKSAGEQAHQSPEELAAAAIARQFGAQSVMPTPEQQAKDRLLSLMRARGHLTDPRSLPSHTEFADLPPAGSQEEAQLLDELGEELSDALEQSGLSILDLIERR